MHSVSFFFFFFPRPTEIKISHAENNQQKSNIPSEERHRYYDFVDTPGHFRPSSPLIERQQLSPELESDVRYACKLLFLAIERGKPVRDSTQSEIAPEILVTGQDGPTIETTEDGGLLQTNSLTLDEMLGGSSKIENHDSDVDLDVEQPNEAKKQSPNGAPARGSGIDFTIEDAINAMNNLNLSPSALSSEETSSHRQSAERPLTVTAEPSFDCMSKPRMPSIELNDNEPSVNGPHSTGDASPSYGPTKGETDPNSAQLKSNTGATLSPYRPLSHLQPRPSLSVRRNFSQKLPAWDDARTGFGVSSFSSQPSSPEIDAPPGYNRERPHSAIELGSSGLHQRRGSAVIINPGGIVHVMDTAEKTQRQFDLQRAVMEKMYTGIIGPSSTKMPVGEMPEDLQRRIYLQRTVMEKMTGIVNVDAAGYATLPRASSVRNPSSPGYQPGTSMHQGITFPQHRSHQPNVGGTFVDSAWSPSVPLGPRGSGKQKHKPGFRARLSVFGLGKRKQNHSHNNSSIMGFDRALAA